MRPIRPAKHFEIENITFLREEWTKTQRWLRLGIKGVSLDEAHLDITWDSKGAIKDNIRWTLDHIYINPKSKLRKSGMSFVLIEGMRKFLSKLKVNRVALEADNIKYWKHMSKHYRVEFFECAGLRGVCGILYL